MDHCCHHQEDQMVKLRSIPFSAPVAVSVHDPPVELSITSLIRPALERPALAFIVACICFYLDYQLLTSLRRVYIRLVSIDRRGMAPLVAFDVIGLDIPAVSIQLLRLSEHTLVVGLLVAGTSMRHISIPSSISLNVTNR